MQYKHLALNPMCVNEDLMSYLCTAHASIAWKILVNMVVIVIMVVVKMIPPADCSHLYLAFSDQSGRRPAGFLPCRTGFFWAAVLSLMSFTWFHLQLGAVHCRGADLLSRRPHSLLVVQVVTAVLIF